MKISVKNLILLPGATDARRPARGQDEEAAPTRASSAKGFYCTKETFGPPIMSHESCVDLSGNHGGRRRREAGEDPSGRRERARGLQKTGHRLSFSFYVP